MINMNKFDKRCDEILRDIKKQELTSPSWGWICVGAVIGFVASCVRFGSEKVQLGNNTTQFRSGTGRKNV